MATSTLLDIVQGILSTLDSDPVNDISDTIESSQVALIVRKVFFDIAEEYGVPKHRNISSLEAVSDVNKPSHLKLPSNVSAMEWFKYNVKEDFTDPDKYADVAYKTPKDFMDMCNMRDTTDTDNFKVVSIDNNVKVTINRKSPPRYWTTFDDTYIVCDGYDVDVDTTLQASKTQVYLELLPTFILENSYVPQLPEQLSSLLYRTAENEAYAIFKQTINPKLQEKEHDFRIRAQRNKYRATQYENNFFNSAINFGRNTRGRS